MRYQRLIWAGLGILILAGLVALALLSNRLQAEAGVALNTPQRIEQIPTESGTETVEAEETPEAAATETTSDAENTPEIQPDAEANNSVTPTSLSRVNRSITPESEPSNTPTD